VSNFAGSDAELVAAVRDGDRIAAGKLAERHLRGARAVAIAIMGDVDAAEDVCQDAFVYAIEKIDDCREPERFSAWLRQIVRSGARNQLRHQRVRRAEPLSPDTAARGDSPAAFVERSDLRRRLLDALGTLTEMRREIVLLHDLEGWTHLEIAERLEMPPGTVRSHLHFARRALRELLADFRKED
jgi:RNA polymerase sigma-70 factor (ECF subfamily)